MHRRTQVQHATPADGCAVGTQPEREVSPSRDTIKKKVTHSQFGEECF